VHGFVPDLVFGVLDVGGDDEFAFVGGVAVFGFDGGVVADVFSLYECAISIGCEAEGAPRRRTSLGFSADIGFPMRFLSCHSNTTTLTIGSASPSSFVFKNLTSMKGSTGPPHDFRLYMPEHRCVLPSFWVYGLLINV